MASPSLTAAFTVTRLTIRVSLTKGFCVQLCPHMRPFTPHGRDWTPLQRRTPRLGEVRWLRPALPAGKGTAGRKPTPPPPSSCCVHWTQGETEAQTRIAQGCPVRAQKARTLSVVPAATPKGYVLPQPSRGNGEASGQTSSQEQGHSHLARLPNTAAHGHRGRSGNPEGGHLGNNRPGPQESSVSCSSFSPPKDTR